MPSAAGGLVGESSFAIQGNLCFYTPRPKISNLLAFHLGA